MSRAAEHAVAMHQLATERRANRRPIWDSQINLGDLFHNDDLTFEQRRDGIVARVRATRWARDSYTVTELLDELGDTTDVDEFDEVWNLIYDEADYDRVWIATF